LSLLRESDSLALLRRGATYAESQLVFRNTAGAYIVAGTCSWCRGPAPGRRRIALPLRGGRFSLATWPRGSRAPLIDNLTPAAYGWVVIAYVDGGGRRRAADSAIVGTWVWSTVPERPRPWEDARRRRHSEGNLWPRASRPWAAWCRRLRPSLRGILRSAPAGKSSGRRNTVSLGLPRRRTCNAKSGV